MDTKTRESALAGRVGAATGALAIFIMVRRLPDPMRCMMSWMMSQMMKGMEPGAMPDT